MKFAIAAVLSLFAASAHAENWVQTYTNGGVVEYVDTDTIKRNGSNATASFKRDYNDGVKRYSEDADGKHFPMAQSRSVKTFDCSGNDHTTDQSWDISPDGKKQSAVKSYGMSRNNDTWEAAAKKAACK